MTQATDTDIRELKTAIDGNTKAVEAIDRRLEALTVTIVGGILLTLGRFLFFGISIKP